MRKRDRDISAEIYANFYHDKNVKLVIGNELGRGTGAAVYHAQLLFEDGVYWECAAKRLSDDSPELPPEFNLQNILTSGIDSSANAGLLRFIGVKKATDGCPYAILPKCDATLSTYLSLIQKQKLENPILFQAIFIDFFHSMLCAFKNLSNKKIIHRDIKPDNIALRHGKFCLLDFGCARTYQDPEKQSGTLKYLAPEILVEENIDLPFAGDVYALGQIFRQLQNEPVDFTGSNNRYLHIFEKTEAYNNAKKTHPKINDPQKFLQTGISSKNTFDDCVDFIVESMCQFLPENRPNIDTLTFMFQKLQSLLSSEAVAINQEDINEFFSNNRPVTQVMRAITARVHTPPPERFLMAEKSPLKSVNPNLFFSPAPKNPLPSPSKSPSSKRPWERSESAQPTDSPIKFPPIESDLRGLGTRY